MKNRFVRRGVILLVAGIVFNIAGYVMDEHNIDYYRWLMIAGVIMFGIGFITIFYSFIRNVEAEGIKEERAEEKEKKKRFRLESRKKNKPAAQA